MTCFCFSFISSRISAGERLAGLVNYRRSGRARADGCVRAGEMLIETFRDWLLIVWIDLDVDYLCVMGTFTNLTVIFCTPVPRPNSAVIFRGKFSAYYLYREDGVFADNSKEVIIVSCVFLIHD